MEGRPFSSYIDHTNLKADATRDDIIRLCREAADYSFFAVCVTPYFVAQAVRQLNGTNVKVAAVVGFPLGTHTTAAKVFEAGEAVQNGASEIDLVINVGALKEGLTRYVGEEILRVKAVTENALLKVILETGLLRDEEKRLAAAIAADSGADMLKTSTGFHGGATADDVRLLRDASPLPVKASGGIRTAESALALITAGADRLGTSSAIDIIQEIQNRR